MSLLKSDVVSLLLVEVDSFVHPTFKSVWDLLHRVDHGGDLDVQSFSKESSHFWSISCLGLCN